MMSLAEYLFVAFLATWTVCSAFRLVHMYDATSPFQRWRQLDIFHLVPVGAFFGPRPPSTEQRILIRDYLANGSLTPWTEILQVQPRSWLHSIWNPQKQMYRVKMEVARSLLQDAALLSSDGKEIAGALLISDAYIAILRYISDLRRLDTPLATQFVVIEVDLLTRTICRSVVSALHEV